jgi:hypothetical protein
VSSSLPNDVTDLARGQIDGDELAVQLIRQADIPAAERTMRLFAEAATTLAGLKASKQL